MNYSELHYILCIAQHQNLTRAAQELYISQPTLTKHLQKLEREMGAKLFSRNGNTYVPTYTGRKYMEYARKILQVKQDWEKELKDLTENNEGELNIAVPLMRSSCMIPQIMAEFSEKYPNVNVSIWEEAYSIQEKLLLNDQLDFGIFNETREHPKLEYETAEKRGNSSGYATGSSVGIFRISVSLRPVSENRSVHACQRTFYSPFSGTDHRKTGS